ncbi:MAG: MarR family transcriptional regulator [Candidatus Omnitrophica bacterium]|nr:MarR family transcriptional regulator [Candidatus Omnitrophota bacterium]
MKTAQSFLRELGYPLGKPETGDEALYGIVWIANQAQRRVAKVLKSFGLTPVKLNYLMIVKHIGKEEGLSQREIARRLLIDAGNVTHVLDDLEKKGWVIRASGPDRRSNRIRITREGSRLLDGAWPVYKEAVKGMIGRMPSQDQRRLVEILSGWKAGLEG